MKKFLEDLEYRRLSGEKFQEFLKSVHDILGKESHHYLISVIRFVWTPSGTFPTISNTKEIWNTMLDLAKV